MKFIGLALSVIAIYSTSWSKSPRMKKAHLKAKFFSEQKSRGDFLVECLNNKELIDFDYNVQCEANYHHYHSNGHKKFYDRNKAIEKGDIKISEFNVLHPGMGKTRFKDYKKVAQMLKNFDIIGVTELIPLMGDDYNANQDLISFLGSVDGEIKNLKEEIKNLKVSINASRRGSTVKRRNLVLRERKLQQLIEDKQDAKSLYRKPGYLRILDQLHQMHEGEDWALILSPRGEGPETNNTKELVGYYYKSSLIKPKVNKYCKVSRTWGKASPIACIINLDAKDMGEDKSAAFSRRPFLAEFISGKFSFALLTSHVLFDSPEDPNIMRFIMQKSFGVDDYRGLGTGMAKDNYARFAEVKMTFDFIENRLKKIRGHQKDIIYMGDLNLESKNKFWPNVLSAWPGSQVFIDGKTSISKSRYNKAGSPTFAKASNYDHFIFDPAETDECIKTVSQGTKAELNGGVYDFVYGRLKGYINRIYKVRQEKYIEQSKEEQEENLAPQYMKNLTKYKKVFNRFVGPMISGEEPILKIGKKNARYGKFSLASRGIIEDTVAINEYALYFQERILDSQLNDKTYYSYFEQLISDHYPIYMSCSNR